MGSCFREETTQDKTLSSHQRVILHQTETTLHKVDRLQGHQVIDSLLKRHQPERFTSHQWEKMKNNLKGLSQSTFLQDIIPSQWTVKDIFGCHPSHPTQR